MIACRLSHNASIIAVGGMRIRTFGDPAAAYGTRHTEGSSEFDMHPRYGSEIVGLVPLREGVVHIVTDRYVLLLESQEPHALNFEIKYSWPL